MWQNWCTSITSQQQPIDAQFQSMYYWLEYHLHWRTATHDLPEMCFIFDKTHLLDHIKLQQLIQTLDKVILPRHHHQIEIQWYTNEFATINQKTLNEIKLFISSV